MAGIRIGGSAILPPVCSPPFSMLQLSGDVNIFRSCDGDAPGTPTSYTDYADGGTTTSAMHNPVLSPDGNTIVYEQRDNSGYLEIWVVDNTPGSTPVQLYAVANQYCWQPSWHPNSDTIVFIEGTGGAQSTGGIVKKINMSGGGATTLKASSGGLSPFRPHFNFDGSRIAYVWNKDNFTAGSQIRVMDDDGSNDASVDSITGRQTNDPQISWANAQNTLAYDNGAAGANGIYLINDDGTGKTQLNANGAAAGATARISSFAWLPDDSAVIISANLGNGFYDLIQCELDGSNTTRLNTSNGASLQAQFTMVIVYNSRLWFIEKSANTSQGLLSSTALDGTDYVNNLDVDAGVITDGSTAFSGGTGFYFT